MRLAYPLGVYLTLAAFFGVSASIQLKRYPVDLRATLGIFVCLLWLLALYLAPAFAATRLRLAGVRRALAVVAVFLAPYFIYAAGTGQFRWESFGKLAALAVVPLGIYAVAPVREPRRMHWQDVVVLLWLSAPVLLRWIRGIWTVPVNLDFMTRLFLVGVGAWSFLVFRGLEGVGYEFRFSRRILHDGLRNFLFFAVAGIPLGFVLRFISWNPQWRGLWTFVFDYVTIFLFIAVTEELFFRGFLQNLLEGTWESRRRAQAAASVLFGLSHILHAPVPNWRYVILATIAGWFYGSAWRSTRSLMASATTHALVDTVWRTWLTRPRG